MQIGDQKNLECSAKRIADAPLTLPLQEQIMASGERYAIHPAPLEMLPHEWVGKRLRLVVEVDSDG